METTRTPGALQGFRDFLMKGNVLDLAIAIILGVAFGGVISALVAGVLMPLIAAIVGEPNFDALTFTIGDGVIAYGTFLTALVNFVIVGASLYLIVRAVAKLQARRVVHIDEAPAPAPTEDQRLLVEIRDLLARSIVR